MYSAVIMLSATRNANVMCKVDGCCIINTKYQTTVKMNAHVTTDLSNELDFFACERSSCILGFARGKGDCFELLASKADK